MNPPVAAPPYLSPLPTQGKVLRKLFLTLFLRGRSARGLQKEAAPKSVGQKLAMALVFYGLYGAFALFFLRQNVLALSIYLHAMTFLFLGMFVASSAGEVLFNKDEADILLHRPVNPKAMLWAKISVMVQVALWLALALNLIGLFVGIGVQDGGWLYPLAHAASTVLEAFFCTGVVVLTYQLCLRWFGRERLDGLMTMAQVFVSIFLIAGGQLLPRLMGGMTQATASHLDSWWLALLPPMWFASFDDALAGRGTLYSWSLAGLGIIVTGVILLFAFEKLSQSYETGLQKLSESAPTKPKKLRRRWINTLIQLPPLSWWLRDPVTRASFLLTTAYMLRDREVKLRLYPGIVPVLILPIIFLFQSRTPGAGGGFGLTFAGCYLGLLPMLAQNILQYSQQWAAADLFRIAPLSGPGAICHGARKAVLLFLTLPLILLLFVITLGMHTSLSQLILFLPGLLSIPIFALLPGLLGKDVPLSQPPEDAKAANRGMAMFGMMIVALALAGVATLAWAQGWFHWLLLGEAAVVAVFYIYGRARLNRMKWEPIQ